MTRPIVVLIEADPDRRLSYERGLRDNGYDVLACADSDGLTALRVGRRPVIVIVDAGASAPAASERIRRARESLADPNLVLHTAAALVTPTACHPTDDARVVKTAHLAALRSTVRCLLSRAAGEDSDFARQCHPPRRSSSQDLSERDPAGPFLPCLLWRSERTDLRAGNGAVCLSATRRPDGHGTER